MSRGICYNPVVIKTFSSESEEFDKKCLVCLVLRRAPSKLWLVLYILVETHFHQTGGMGPGILGKVVLHQNHLGNHFPNKHARTSRRPSESESLGEWGPCRHIF